LRYEEDYSTLKTDSIGSFYRELKYMPLSRNNDTYFSFGGEARTQYIYYKHDLWSDNPEATHGEILNRFLLHGHLHYKKHFKMFLQLQTSMALGKQLSSAVDNNMLEFHQGFIEYKTPLPTASEFVVRTGRQELSYGSERLVSVREGPNNRQSFDAVKLILNKENFVANAFFSYHVKSKKGILNDRLSSYATFWGMYVTKNHVSFFSNIDLYYLGLLKRQASFDDGIGRELRHSVGTRLWNNTSDWKYDFEAVYQFGSLAQKNIRAWTASINTSYTFSKFKYSPTIGIKTEIISGNKSYGDQSIQTFNPLFPKGGYFGLAALLGPENLVGIHPSVSATLIPGLVLGVDYDKIWRQSVHDGIYAPNGFLIYTGKNTNAKVVGNQYSLVSNHTLNRMLSFDAVFTWFDAGDYLREVSAGKGVFFTAINAKVKF
jgi:hypothetical protein